MSQLTGQARSQYVQDMFGRIAGRYNMMNRLMTFGQDMRWRRFVVDKAQLTDSSRLLDLATGTGDIAFEAARRYPKAEIIGADFAIPMMQVGREQPIGALIAWHNADAMNLPYPDSYFDAVVSGYLVRNVIDIDQTLREQYRTLTPGGRIVILDTSPPPHNLLRPFILFHLKYVIPTLGRLISGSEGADAYEYLPESTQAFKTPDELAGLMRDNGFEQVQYRQFMFGTMAVHWGVRPA